MIDFLVSLVSTTIEGACLFVLTLNLFRFRARDYILGIVVANIVVSVSNYLMEKYSFYYDYTMLLNFMVFVLVLIFLFRVALFESIVMTVVGYLAILIIQIILFAVFTLFVKTTLHEVRVDDYQYLLQLISAGLMLGAAKAINKYHWWFTFVPFKWKFKIKLTRLNIALMLTAITTVVFLALYIKYFNIMIIGSFLLLLIAVVLFFVIKKENMNTQGELT